MACVPDDCCRRSTPLIVPPGPEVGTVRSCVDCGKIYEAVEVDGLNDARLSEKCGRLGIRTAWMHRTLPEPMVEQPYKAASREGAPEARTDWSQVGVNEMPVSRERLPMLPVVKGKPL